MPKNRNPKSLTEEEADRRADVKSLAAIRRMSKADKRLIPAWKVAEELGFYDLAAKLKP